MAKSEHLIQTVFMNWCRNLAKFHDPRFTLAHSIPNGGKRGKREAHRLKLEGVRPGIPDVFIPIPSTTCHGLYIEFKDETGTISSQQREVIPLLQKQGYHVVVCRSAEEAKREVERYLNVRLPGLDH